MADKMNILVAGRHAEIVPTVIRLLHNNAEWNPTGTLTNAESISYMETHPVDILLLSSGISETDEEDLRLRLAQLHPQAIVIQHYGGGSGLLAAEIYEAVANR